jgi:diguanylate cyclase (GGDEF)-like protein
VILSKIYGPEPVNYSKIYTLRGYAVEQEEGGVVERRSRPTTPYTSLAPSLSMNVFERNWQNLPLGGKITGLTSIVTILAVLAFAYLFIQRERTNFQQELTNQANLLLETIPLTMRDQLSGMELDELTDIAQAINDNENITMFIVYDERGVILVDSSQPNKTISQTIDPLGASLVAHHQDEPYTNLQEDQLVAGRAIMLDNQPIGAFAVHLSTEPLDRKITTIVLQSALLGLIVLLVGGGLTILFSRQITTPIRELTNLASQMAGGNLTIRTKIQSKDETGQLGDTFNYMAGAIHKRETELRNLASELERTVAERTAEMLQQNEFLEKMAISDPLTKCFNRRYFFDLAEKEVERSRRYGHPLSVIILDADHFKSVNDTFGHQIGDQTLINLANFCQENIRKVDIFARYGGEEFVILMPETEYEDAHQTANRLRKLVAKTPMISGENEVRITISLGVACWNGQDSLNFDTLLSHADQALYRAKEMGRNRVSVWEMSAPD